MFALAVALTQHFREQPRQPGRGPSSACRAVRGAVLGDDIGRRPTVGGSQLDRAELVEIPGQRRLSDLQAGHPERGSELGLRVDRALGEERDDAGVPHRLAPPRSPSSPRRAAIAPISRG